MTTAVFIAELTDKDALLILALATKIRPRIVFASGLVAFTITTAIIVSLGSFLISVLPVFWITLSGAVIMIGYGVLLLLRVRNDEESLNEEETRLLKRSTEKNAWSTFLSIVPMLVLLDLAGDATEILIIVFVANLQNVVLVFVGSLVALAAATALETTIGHTLSRILSLQRIKLVSSLVFLTLGIVVIVGMLAG
ncbi:MAG: TMEM165/GDT1 family protein [Candidatus Bathyarchaeia archaeon]